MSEAKKEFDPERFKQQERAGFNLVAERYEPAMIAMTQPVVTQLLEMAQLSAGQKVLDVATGPGILARKAAPLVGTSGQVLGVDIAEDAIAVARKKAVAEGHSNITFEAMDAEAMPLADAYFDRVLCSMGLMHFPNTATALAEMGRVLVPGGRLTAAVWGEDSQIPFLEIAINTFAKVFPPPKVAQPAMSRFGTPEILTTLFNTAGFTNVETRAVTIPITVTDAKAYWKQFLDVAGVTTVVLAKQPPEVMQRLEDVSASELERFAHNGTYQLDSVIMLATGVK